MWWVGGFGGRLSSSALGMASRRRCIWWPAGPSPEFLLPFNETLAMSLHSRLGRARRVDTTASFLFESWMVHTGRCIVLSESCSFPLHPGQFLHSGLPPSPRATLSPPPSRYRSTGVHPWVSLSCSRLVREPDAIFRLFCLALFYAFLLLLLLVCLTVSR